MPANDQNASHEPNTNTEITFDRDTFRRLGYHAVDLAADYLVETRSRAAFHPMLPDERQALLEQELPLERGSQQPSLIFFSKTFCHIPWATAIHVSLAG